MDRKGQVVGKTTISHVQANAKDTQIAPVRTIDEMAQSISPFLLAYTEQAAFNRLN